jgi:DNA-binding CsgD family transcriptional regulator
MASQKEELSERELELLRLVAQGATNQQIARELTISVNTVKVHLRNIFAKLDVQSRTEATMAAVRIGLIQVKTQTELPQADGSAEPLPLTWPSIVPGFGRWQRVYLALATTAAIALVALSAIGRKPEAAALDTAFVDQSASAQAVTQRMPSRWTTRAPVPSPRGRLAVVASGDSIFVIGGVSEGQVTGLLEEYRPAEDRWVTGLPKPTPAANISAVSLDGKVYVPGGHDAGAGVLDTLEIYDIATGVWEVGTPLPAPRSAYALAEIGGRIYLFGGWDGKQYVATVLELSPDTEEWRTLSPMPAALGFQAVAVVDGKAYVMGGYDGTREYAACYEYAPAREDSGESPWRERSPMSAPRGGASAAAVGTSLYVVGGGWTGFLAYNERYEPQSDTWVRFATPVTGQWRNLGVAPFETRLYAIGGWSGEDLGINAEYQAIYRVVVPHAVR